MTEETSVLGRGQRVTEPKTESRMFSLMEVAQETGIAMPILLRYKREHPERIPSMGSGAQQRFPEEAFAIFEEIRDEESQDRDLPRRGGFGLLSLPRIRRSREQPEEKSPDAKTEPSAATEEPSTRDDVSSKENREHIEETTDRPSEGSDAPAAVESPRAAGAATLTLKDVSEQLGIAYPTVARYAAKYPERIPHEGEGRQRRFPPEAIEVFRQIRKESKPGRPPKSKSRKTVRPAAERATESEPAAERPVAQASVADQRALVSRIERLEREHQQLVTLVRHLRQEIERPLTATVDQD